MNNGALEQFAQGGRLKLAFDGKTAVRAVYRTEILRRTEAAVLESYVADRTPYFYNEPAQIAKKLEEGFFLSAINEILVRIPKADSFRESHFGEILAGIYGEELLGLRRLYSKLALLTAENANAYKMDVLFYRPGSDPAEFVFTEVKSSMKTADDGLPAGHDRVCFAKLFASLNRYGDDDVRFDLAAIRDRLDQIPEPDRDRIRTALLPHRPKNIRYAGMCVIDGGTHDEAESSVLGTRKNRRVFDVDVICVTELPAVVDATYQLLDSVRT